MNETHRRPWWRLHALTVIAIAGAAAAMLAVNAWGREIQSEYPGVFVRHYGWPITIHSHRVWGSKFSHAARWIDPDSIRRRMPLEEMSVCQRALKRYQ